MPEKAVLLFPPQPLCAPSLTLEPRPESAEEEVSENRSNPPPRKMRGGASQRKNDFAEQKLEENKLEGRLGLCLKTFSSERVGPGATVMKPSLFASLPQSLPCSKGTRQL